MKWTRRAILAGGAAAGASCFMSRRRIDGAIVGASHEAGHRLRGRDFPDPSASIDVPVAILGAGVAGLGAAWRLRKSGFDDFAVFDLEAGPGGNARPGRNDVTAFPWGAHYVPIPNRETRDVRELFEEMGVITGYDGAGAPACDERFLCFDPQERLFVDGVWVEGLFPHRIATAEDEAQLRDFHAAMDEEGARRRFTLPVDLGDADRDLDAISTAEYMDRRGWTSPLLRWYVDYACRDDYGCTSATTSAYAGVHYFTVRQDDRVLTWPAGNGWIVERLARPLGKRLQCGKLVARVIPDGDRVRVHVFDVRTKRVTEVRCRRAICALPRYAARRVMDGVDGAGFTYAPWMVANLTVDGMPEGRGFPPAWDNVLYGSPSLGYVVATHQSLSTRPGPSVLTYYRAMTGPDPDAERRAMLRRTWESWRDEILGDLARAHPRIADAVRRIDVMLWGHAMIRPTPGFIWGPARRAAPGGPVVFANSDMSGLPLFEEALSRGSDAARAVLQGI